MKKIFLLVFGLMLIIIMVGCGVDTDNQLLTESLPDVDGNPYTTHETIDGETYVYCDYSEVYDKLDLSQYTSYGSFGEDGLMWVEKSDYTGKKFAYIDWKGNIVIPFTSEIATPHDFRYGNAIVSYEYDVMGNGMCGVINTTGEVKLKFDNHAISEWYHSTNGNIVFIGINLIDDLNSEPKNYIYCSNTGTTIEIPDGPIKNEPMYYSDGWLRTYRTESYLNENNVFDTKRIVTFYDEYGEVVLVVDSNSSPHYKALRYVADFSNGKSIVTFLGQDRELYKVEINKKGEWIGEPWKTNENEIGNEYFA